MFTSRLETLLNRQAQGSPRAQELLGLTQDRSVRIEVRYTPWKLVVRSDGTALSLSREMEGTQDALVSGTPLSLAALAGPSPEAVIRRGDVRIEGDAEVASRFRELAMLLRPELEEELSRLVGDVPAHHLGSLLRQAWNWSRSSAATTGRNVAEYLAHESRDLIPRAEGHDFIRGVDQLRESVDRLEARIASLAITAVANGERT